MKSEWYQLFTGLAKPKARNIFSMIDAKEHAKHRRNQANNFSDKWIKALEPIGTRNVAMTVAGMKREFETQGQMDVFKWFTFMATDVVGEASFGESFKLLESGKTNQYTEDLDAAGSSGLFAAELPLLIQVLGRLPFGPAVSAKEGVERIVTYAVQSLERYKKQLALDPDVKPTLLTNSYRLVDDGTRSKEQQIQDAPGNIIAGTDTTPVTTTYLIWNLAHHPTIQAQVIAEVEKLPIDCTDDEIRNVELFGRVINETLSLCGAASGSMPRDVPVGGVTVCGHYIPGGTTISTQGLQPASNRKHLGECR